MTQLKWFGGFLLLFLLVWGSGNPHLQWVGAGESVTVFLPLVTVPSSGSNLLPNPSFEGGWYHPDGIPELQIPEDWQFAYDEGDNPLDPDPWNAWVRPETRVLTSAFLPPAEQTLFIWEGDQTVKVFKGYGSISFALTTAVFLQPGTYILEINLFPDLVTGYDNGQKIWASDPLSGEVKLIAGSGTTDWLLPNIGQRNTFQTSFTLSSSQTVVVGAAMRGRWAIQNNGWFMDDWWLYQQ